MTLLDLMINIKELVLNNNMLNESEAYTLKQKTNESPSFDFYRVLKIEISTLVESLKVIEMLDKSLGRKEINELYLMQIGDVKATAANTDLLESLLYFRSLKSNKIYIYKVAQFPNCINK